MLDPRRIPRNQLQRDRSHSCVIPARRIEREMRTDRALTQAQLARLIRSSQSRVAKTEAADSSVSIDLLVRTLVASGTSGATIGRAFAEIDVRRKVRRSA